MTKSEIRRELAKRKASITLNDLAFSDALVDFLSAGITAIFKAFGIKRFERRPLQIRLIRGGNTTACTNDSEVRINVMNPFFREDIFHDEVSLKEFYLRLLGVMYHEIGHILYTQFSVLTAREHRFQKGGIYALPDLEETYGLAEKYELLRDLIKEPRTANFVFEMYSKVMNIVEDGRIEKKLLALDDFYVFKTGLKILREHQLQSALYIKGDLKHDIQTFFHACLIYAKFGEVDPDIRVYFPDFDKARKTIDEMLFTDEGERFSDLAGLLLSCVADIIKDNLDRKDSEGDSKKDKSEKGEDSDKGSGDDSDCEMTEDEILEAIEKMLSETGTGTEMPDMSEDGKAGEKPSETDEESGDGKSSAKGDGEDESEDKALESVLTSLSEEMLENDSKKASDAETRRMLGEGAAGDHCWETNIVDPDPAPNWESVIRQINDSASGMAVKKAAREIMRNFEADMRTGANKRKMCGKKFHAENLVRKDYRYFEKRAVKKDVPDMALAICVDESGSMCSGNRWQAARNAAICLYELFELIPNMDIAIYGHTGDLGCRRSVDIIPYAEFGLKRRDTLKNLTAISARSQNRDISAVELCAEKLLQQPADVKLMIVISDGEPCAGGYGGTAACAELTKAVNEYSKKGIEIIAAAIGDDRDAIREIYQGQKFLDISNLADLPKTLVSVIKRRL